MITTLDKICTLGGGAGFPEKYQGRKEGDYPFIKVSDMNLVGNERCISHANNYLDESDRHTLGAKVFGKGATVFAKVGAALNLNRRRMLIGETLIDNNMMAATPFAERVLPEYLFYCLSRIDLGQISQVGSVPSVNQEQVGSLRVFCPEKIKEQQKIVEILSDFDTAIKNSSEKIECLKSELRGFREALIANTAAELQRVKFSDVFERITSPNNGRSDNVLTISGQHGLVSQTDYFNKSVAGTDISGYYYLQRGDFAYNRSYSDGYPMGAIKTLSKYEDGVVSTLYMCFRLKAGCGQHDFLRHYFETSLFNRELVKIVQEGGRAHGLLNLNLSDFYATKLFMPSLNRQSEVAMILGEIECELKLASEQFELFKKQKRGLMQQLLTGKLRVQGAA